MLTTTAALTASGGCQLLRRLAAQHVGLPLTVGLDNARYQTCHVVKDVAADRQIERLYLPRYAPNLNLIERLWKFVKKPCLYAQYYPDFESFRRAIKNGLEAVNTTPKAALKSLLTWNFQSFEKVKVLAN